MHIKVFGPGCDRCLETEKLVQEVAAAKGGNITVEKVSNMREMMALGILSTPAVAVDGVVRSRGKIPTKGEIAAWIDDASSPVPPFPPGSGCCCCGGRR